MFARRRPATRPRAPRHAPARKRFSRLLRVEFLEPRTVLSALSPLSSLHITPAHGTSAIRPTASLAPTIAKPAALTAAGSVTGKSAVLSVLGADSHGESSLVYTWRVASAPKGAAASFGVNGSNAAKNDTIAFTAAGTYGLVVTIANTGGMSVSSGLQITVLQTFAAIGVYPAGAKAALGSGTLNVTGRSQGLSATALDQFGSALSAQPGFSWTATASPSGAAPSLSGSKGSVTLSFSKAGSYTETVTATTTNGSRVSAATAINVVQTLTGLTVTPGTAGLLSGGTQQFQAAAFDQFNSAITSPLAVTWTASGGAITSGGLFTAPNAAAKVTITAKSGTLVSTATVTVTSRAPNPSPSPAAGPKLQDPALTKLVASLDADGSLNRDDVMQILTSAGNDGAVSASELADLKTIVANASYYNMPDYVCVLAGDVVNGNPANAAYQGAALGNLAAGSSSAQLNKLIGKWFQGTDRPALNDSTLTYAMASGSLFPTAPSHNDERQGALGDCYFISALGTIADQNPQAIVNMFIDNGDGTFTVRFYAGIYGSTYNANGSISDGFIGGKATADYVTVDRSVATYIGSGGAMAYANFGQYASNPSNSLWIPLAEKAYAQWNQTGKEGRDGKNAYASIEGGWMGVVDAQVLGRNASDYTVSDSTKQAMINALAAHQAVTIGTKGSASSDDSLPFGLYGSHAYAVIGYNAAADLFTLYNPWGVCQPGVLSWAQLEATTTGFVVAG